MSPSPTCMPGFRGAVLPACTSQAGDCTAVTTLPTGGLDDAGVEAESVPAACAERFSVRPKAAASTRLGCLIMVFSLDGFLEMLVRRLYAADAGADAGAKRLEIQGLQTGTAVRS